MSTIRDSLRPEDWDRIVSIVPEVYEGTIATPEDVRDRMNYQIDRYLELDNRRQLTPQYRKFGKKHREEIWKRTDSFVREAGEPAHFTRGKER